MTTPATFPSPGPSFAAGTAAGGTLILFGCVPFSAANVAGGLISSQAFRIGRGKSRGGLPFFPKGPLSPVHHLKSIPSFFGFRVSKHPLNCAVEPFTFGARTRIFFGRRLLHWSARLHLVAFWIAPELKENDA